MAAGLGIVWGRRDCATLAADRYREHTGVDPMADLRGAYATAREALRVMRRCGGMIAAWEARTSWPRVAAQRAEVAVLPATPWPVFAVREGAYWRAPGADGPMDIRADLVEPLASWGPA